MSKNPNQPEHILVNFDEKNLTIASINIGGLNKNIAYLNQLVMQNSVVCVQETWAECKNDLDNSIYITGKKIIYKHAIRRSKVGRASGGLAFIDENLVFKQKFYSDRIGELTIGNLTILNIYLTFNDGSARSKEEFQNDLIFLQEILKRNANKRNTIIIGDFNADPIKNNFHSEELNKFLFSNNLILNDVYSPQQVDFTFYSKHKNGKEIKSWIDHCATEVNNDSISNVKILKSKNNLGDHNAISLLYKCNFENEIPKHAEKEKIRKINWNNSNEVSCDRQRLEKNLLKLYTELDKLKRENDKGKLKLAITKFLNEISYVFIDSLKKTQNELKNRKKGHKKKVKLKSWWDKTIQKLHGEVVHYYIIYRDSNFAQNKKKDYLEAKRIFRERKRYNIKLKRDKNFKKIDNLFRLNKTEFWKKIKSMSRDTKEVDIEVDQLEKEYIKLFKEGNKTDKSDAAICKARVDDFVDKFRNMNFDVNLESNELVELIKNLPSGKSSG
ncbi:unnamed protein product [Brachionus calyciflorus]|uniref:Endonuclease/exonuclease/phosphatase domain-containing protein n=1 Tax=Brachionus calyciflorus TaxID=104777 RepID=A0A814DC92_9BILA|nr:unnamed protein product [Brachionus calyciflorus]